MKTLFLITFTYIAFTVASCAQTDKTQHIMESYEVKKTEEEWKKQLTDEQYQVLRQKGTERPYSGQYYRLDDDGIYKCAACDNPLFKSDTKFDAGCGWPSFYEPVSPGSVVEHKDNTHGMIRTEVVCGKCGSHLGHVFNDAPDQPTGLRYCINSVSLDFDKKVAPVKGGNKVE